jgi:hypothetical protein
MWNTVDNKCDSKVENAGVQSEYGRDEGVLRDTL